MNLIADENDDDSFVEVIDPPESPPVLLSAATDIAGNPLPARGRPRANPPRFTCCTTDSFSHRHGYYYFIVRGRPVAKPRPTIASGRYINPVRSLQADFVATVGKLVERKTGALPAMLNGQLRLNVRFFFPEHIMVEYCGDCNNLANFVQDSLEGSFFGNDGSIVSLTVKKMHSNSHGGNGYTIVQLRSVTY